ncbi:arylesterase [Methylosoma difficile]
MCAFGQSTIVVLGDSISAGYGMEVDQGWVALLQDRLQVSNSPYRLSNASISGETSAGGLARLDHILAAQKPAWVLIELGANDGLRGLSPVALKSNLTIMIDRIRTAGGKVMLLGMKIPPNYGKRYIELFYNVYPQLSQELNVPLVPFMLDKVALNPELMQADGLHPNAKAQSIIADTIQSTLFPLLNH